MGKRWGHWDNYCHLIRGWLMFYCHNIGGGWQMERAEEGGREGREGCYKYLPWQWPAFREAQWQLFGVSSSCVMISKLVIIQVKAVTLSQPSWCVSWLRGTEGNLRYERRGEWENHSSWRQRMERRERKCVEEIQADRSEASSDTLIPITLIAQRYQIWGTWARDGSLITQS